MYFSVDAGSLCVDNNRNNVKLAPTREVLSFRAYSQHRRLNQLRRAACKLFQSQEVVHVVQKVEVEVESDRLYIRKDRKVHADLGKFSDFNYLYIECHIIYKTHLI